MSLKTLRELYFRAQNYCCCSSAPWPLLSAIINAIGKLEDTTVDSVTIDKTVTVDPGQPAYVVNQGTAKNVKLEFGIPEGIPGVNSVEVGETLTLEPGTVAYVANVGDYDHLNLEFGIPGSPTVSVGDVTTLEPGSTPTVENGGTLYDSVLEFGLPAAPSVTVGTTTTLEPGSDATVTNSGTAYAPVLNFGIPEGEKGEQGDAAPAELVVPAVNAWLDEHPEATTTVEDGSITDAKIADNTITDAKLVQSGGILSKVQDITATTRNLLDINYFDVDGLTVSGNTVSGLTSSFYTAFNAGTDFGITFEENAQYTFSCNAYTDQAAAATASGLAIMFHYTDDTTSRAYMLNTWSTANAFSITSTEGKTVDYIATRYHSGSGNTWYLSDIQLEKASSATGYIPHITASDLVARESIEEITADNSTKADCLITPVWQAGTYTSAGATTYNTKNWNTGNEYMHVKAGSKITKDDTTIAITCFFCDNNDNTATPTSSQILRLAETEYTFENDAWIKLLLQNPSSTATDTAWIAQHVHTSLIDADYKYRRTGYDIGILGYEYQLGNCITFKLPTSEVFVIDSFRASAWSQLNTDLHNHGIKHIDRFMVSHYHADHIGNVQNMIDNGYIDESTTVYLPQDLNGEITTGLPSDWTDVYSNYETVKAALTDAGCTLVYPTENQVVSIGGVDIEFWNTDHTVYYTDGAYHSTNYNDFSLCCYVTLGNYVFCDPADLGPIGQRRMADLKTLKKANLYTATHHGWDHGTAANYYGLIPDYINTVSPDVVFSEDYSTHEQYMATKTTPMQSWCEANGVSNYRTYINGSMDVHVDEYGWHLLGSYKRYIRNDKNWSYSDNSEHEES